MMTGDKNVGVYLRSIIISFVLATLIVRKDDFHHLVKSDTTGQVHYCPKGTQLLNRFDAQHADLYSHECTAGN